MSKYPAQETSFSAYETSVPDSTVFNKSSYEKNGSTRSSSSDSGISDHSSTAYLTENDQSDPTTSRIGQYTPTKSQFLRYPTPRSPSASVYTNQSYIAPTACNPSSAQEQSTFSYNLSDNPSSDASSGSEMSHVESLPLDVKSYYAACELDETELGEIKRELAGVSLSTAMSEIKGQERC